MNGLSDGELIDEEEEGMSRNTESGLSCLLLVAFILALGWWLR